MSYAYGDLRSTRDHFQEPRTLTERVLDNIASVARDAQRRWKGRTSDSRSQNNSTTGREGRLRKAFSVVNVLTLLWIFTIYWGERRTFNSAINACDWRHWESWAPGAQPHHVALVADPQLVDPHTYPGRPWPLSSLTIRYTDLYLKRVYRLMQEKLYPDTTIFLGDLFDGGREWSVTGSHGWDNPDKEWKKFGERFWMKEYNRFGKIFFDIFTRVGVAARKGQPSRRKLIITLPGNHDLGFANGVHKPVRDRFNAYFGDGNRLDVIGNHSIIQIDGVSLSAKDQAEEGNQEIWQPTMDFLDSVQDIRKTAIAEELRLQHGIGSRPRYNHSTIQTEELASASLPGVRDLSDARFPAVLLSHVPLYRDPGTPCGPLREHWPPSYSSDGKLLDRDDRNAISVTGGYQYQNVLSNDVTKDVTTRIGDVEYAFSGDDHDYCEVVHRRYPSGGGGIREITVKSISWAMGVRKPGFVILSLWNPVDPDGKPIKTKTQEDGTLQSHLCILPDQLGIFMRYGMLIALTLSLLLLRAGHMSSNPAKSQFAGSESPLLPTMREPSSTDHEKGESSCSDDGYGNNFTEGGRLAARSANSRVRSVSPLGSYGLPPAGTAHTVPLITHAGYYGPAHVEQEEKKAQVYVSKARKLKGLALFYAEFQWSIIRVAYVALPWYFWLIWTG